jgi:phage gpG-like protein
VSEIKGSTELMRRFEAIKDQRMLLGQIAGLAKAEASKLAPVKTGNLRRSIRIGTVSDTSALIYAGAKYAPFVEFGTAGGTIIRPVHRKVLAWGGPRRLSGSLRSGGKATNFAMRVRRGATKAKPFMVPGAKAALEKSGYIVNIIKAWNEAA